MCLWDRIIEVSSLQFNFRRQRGRFLVENRLGLLCTVIWVFYNFIINKLLAIINKVTKANIKIRQKVFV